MNRLSHAAGISHATEVKARLCADLARLREGGASHVALLAHIEAFARAEGGARRNCER
ncbi:MAG: hypothetical protein ING90_08215 [Rhodocyclaceae bacterium]|nr:hypothetical protein [Rhodocyclaceae bacterium]MCA3091179.1 hypothetical protein [Rhodocyclaceae bacterium]MCA3092341.1 hypothetical protein [Rhodocyclaceae bacterium]MCA3122616.1 hypothetical protein [Rhodocyclaceae bacterium]